MIEVLVVVVITAVLTGLVVLGMGRSGPAREAERELQRLSVSLQTMCEQAMLSGSARGLRFSAEGYDFWVYRAGWQRLPDDAVPRPVRWPSGLNPRIRVEDLPVTARTAAAPQVLCTGIEPPTALTVEIGRGDARRRLVWPE